MSTQNIFADDKKGMRVNGLRILRQSSGRGYAYMRRGMADHLEELARAYYAGNIQIVDEFLQLYCIGEAERSAAKATGQPFSQPQEIGQIDRLKQENADLQARLALAEKARDEALRELAEAEAMAEDLRRSLHGYNTQIDPTNHNKNIAQQ